MKLFKNRFFAIVFCFVLILASTLISSKSKMENRYDRVCSQLSESILDFASENGLDTLAVKARSVIIDHDYDGLISMYFAQSIGYNGNDTSKVQKAMDNYTGFLESFDRFPAKQFAWLASFR